MSAFCTNLREAIAERLANGGPVDDEYGAADEILELLVEQGISLSPGLEGENAVLRGIVDRMRHGWRVSKYGHEWYRKSSRAAQTQSEPMTLDETRALGLTPGTPQAGEQR